MPTPLTDTAIAILATDGFEQVELTKPKAALEEAGATVHVVSPESGSIKGWDQDHWGDSVDVDKTLSEADPARYDALVLPGGQINPDKLRIDGDALAFVKAFASAGKPIAAICHGPWLLVETGLAEGRRLTSYKSIRTDLKNAGADVAGPAGGEGRGRPVRPHHEPQPAGHPGLQRGHHRDRRRRADGVAPGPLRLGAEAGPPAPRWPRSAGRVL